HPDETLQRVALGEQCLAALGYALEVRLELEQRAQARIGARAVLPQARQRLVGLADAGLDGADLVLARVQLAARAGERLLQLAPALLALGLRAFEILRALHELGATRLRRGTPLAERSQAFPMTLARALLVRLDREQVERHLLVLQRPRAHGPQLGLDLRQRGLGLVGLGRRGLAAVARAGQLRLHLALARLGLLEALAHARGFLGRFFRALDEARGALAQQHDLVLGRHACFLAVLQATLRRQEFALQLQQRQLLRGECGLGLVQLAGQPLAARGLLLPLFLRRRFPRLQRVQRPSGQGEVEVAHRLSQALVPPRLAHLSGERPKLALDLEHD